MGHIYFILFCGYAALGLCYRQTNVPASFMTFPPIVRVQRIALSDSESYNTAVFDVLLVVLLVYMYDLVANEYL